MITKAAKNKARLVMLPEIFYYAYELKKMPSVAEQKKETLNQLKEIAFKHKIYLCTGSVAEKIGNNIYNSSYLINPQGEVILQYDKCHLFDVDLKRLSIKESAVFTAGNNLSVARTELGTVGILICYDIRFPELARKLTLMGAEILLVPAAFNTVTGPAHWHITFRARAVENQVFIAAASPARNKSTKYQAYGHSLVVNPWGEIIAEAGKKQEIIYSWIKPGILNKTRQRLPLLKQRRPDLYNSIKV